MPTTRRPPCRLADPASGVSARHFQVMTQVHCRSCDARFETDASPEAVTLVRRCGVCGRATLDLDDRCGRDGNERNACAEQNERRQTRIVDEARS